MAKTAMITDMIAFAETTRRDPLVGAFTIIMVGAPVSWLLFKQQPIWRVIVQVIFLILLTLFLLRNEIVPYQPPDASGAAVHDVIAGTLKIAWWLWAAWFLVALTRCVVVFEHRPREGKLLQDLVSALIYLAAVFAIIAYVLDLSVQGLLATSGVIAIVLGLALQSTLSDLFSSLVLCLSRPYRPGDWINIEGGMEGHVLELNWRATHVLTARQDLAIVPNSNIAKSKIVNESFSTSILGVTVAVQLISTTFPASGISILELAVLNRKSILDAPRPTVRVVSIDAAQTGYELTFFIEKYGSETAARNELFDHIFRHVTASDARRASPEHGSCQAYDGEASNSTRTGLDRVLDIMALFASLTSKERAVIASKLKQAFYETGETLVEPGTVPHSLFIVGNGVLSVTRSQHGCGETEVMRFGPGDHFGEISLLTHDQGGDEKGGRDLLLAEAFFAERQKGAELVERMQRRALNNFGRRILLGDSAGADDAGNRRGAGESLLFDQNLKRPVVSAPAGISNMPVSTPSVSMTGRTVRLCTSVRRAMSSASSSIETPASTRRTFACESISLLKECREKSSGRACEPTVTFSFSATGRPVASLDLLTRHENPLHPLPLETRPPPRMLAVCCGRGTGKTHIATAFAVQAIEHHRKEGRAFTPPSNSSMPRNRKRRREKPARSPSGWSVATS